MTDPIASSSRGSPPPPPPAPPPPGQSGDRSRSPSPARGTYTYPQRYNLPPLRSLATNGSSSLHVPPQLPRLVLKTTHADSNFRESSTGYSTMRSAGASGSTSPADYVGGGGARALGSSSGGGGGAGGGHFRDTGIELSSERERGRGRRYSGGSISGRSVSRSASETSLPLAAEGEGDTSASAQERDTTLRREIYRNGRSHFSGSGWTEEESRSGPNSAGVTPGAVLPPIPRTTKVTAPGSISQETPVRGKMVTVLGSVNYSTAKSRKSSCGLCHHRKIRCDQGRPSCGSCTRKGHTCVYADEADKISGQIVTPTNRSITVLSATNPQERTVLTVPNTNTRPSSSPVPPRPSGLTHSASSSSRVGPEWASLRSGLPTPNSAVSNYSPPERNGGYYGQEKPLPQSHEHLAELALAAGVHAKVDEMDNEGMRGRRGSVSHSGSNSLNGDGKRGNSEEGRMNGDDPSGPARKKKKSRQSEPLRVPTNPYRPSSRSSTSGSTTHRPSSALPSSSQSDIYSSSLNSLLSSLPSSDIQRILFDTFFTDPFLNEGITLLQPQFMEDLKSLLERTTSIQICREGDATTLANAFAILATALRIMPGETSRLLLASSLNGMQGQLQPKSLSRILTPHLVSQPDPTPLDQRYFDLALLCAQIAEAGDSPSVMLVMLKLILYRNLAIKQERSVIAGQYLGGAIRIAQALGMGKEWEGIPQGERELRRRVMWCLYIADRHLSFETAFPYTILDAHQGIHLPSPISETDLYKIAQDAQSLPPHSTEVGPTACTALFIHTHLARRITPILDSFATISPSHTPHDLVLRFDQSLDNFQDALPPYMRLFPGTDTRFDNSHQYLPAHRIRLHARILAYRQGVHRSFITTYLRPSAPSGIRGVMANICLSSLRTQRSAKMLDPKIATRIFDPIVVFESAMILGMIVFVERATMGEAGSAAVGKGSAEIMWREGLAGGVELLDNVSGGGDVVRKSVAVLREMCIKVDTQTEDINPSVAEPGKETSPESKTGSSSLGSRSAQAVDTWLDGLAKDRRSLEVLLRDPQWEGGWEVVLKSM